MAVTSTGIDIEKGMVALLKKGDQAAFSGVYDEYAPSLLAIIRHMTHNESLADEILRTAFVQIWLTRTSYNPAIERLFVWMTGIARQVGFAMMIARGQTPDCPAGNGKQMLPGEEPQLLLHLIYFKGYSMERVAQELNCTPEIVRIKVIDAMKDLKGRWIA
jgi:DNA-directed RNA polymerase specialized sigma24 family protein